MVAILVVEALAIAFVVSSVTVAVYLLIGFVVRMRSGDEMEAAHHWSDHVTGGKREQTPEEAVEEWERRRWKRKRLWFRR